jgi:hypothetical protein
MSASFFAVGAIMLGWRCAIYPVAAQQEKPAEICCQLRKLEYRCDDPRQAEHNRKLTKPNEQMWVLQCANARYRVRLIPDLAAHVERHD